MPKALNRRRMHWKDSDRRIASEYAKRIDDRLMGHIAAHPAGRMSDAPLRGQRTEKILAQGHAAARRTDDDDIGQDAWGTLPKPPPWRVKPSAPRGSADSGGEHRHSHLLEAFIHLASRAALASLDQKRAGRG